MENIKLTTEEFNSNGTTKWTQKLHPRLGHVPIPSFLKNPRVLRLPNPRRWFCLTFSGMWIDRSFLHRSSFYRNIHQHRGRFPVRLKPRRCRKTNWNHVCSWRQRDESYSHFRKICPTSLFKQHLLRLLPYALSFISRTSPM